MTSTAIATKSQFQLFETVHPPLKWHGGKHYMARRIIALMPQHLHYVEPFFGGGSVLLAKNPHGISEVVNDLNNRLTNFWRVLQDDNDFAPFSRRIEATPFSETEWQDAHKRGDASDPVADAVAFFINCRQSLAGRQDAFAGISRTRTRRGMNEQASAWIGAVEGLSAVHARLCRVVILDRPAIEVIQKHDGPETLFYLDPPYLHSTRTAPNAYHRYEMTEMDHIELLRTVQGLSGKVLLSGYRSQLYDSTLADWSRHDFDLANNAAGGLNKRRMTECVWCNYTNEL